MIARIAATPELTGVGILIAVLIAFSLVSPAFLTVRNLQNVLLITPELGLITLGLAILIISGEFDLSVGSVFALSPMIVILAFASGLGFWPAVILGLVGAAAVGLANGWITLRFGIPSFIATLGTLFAVRSLTVIISGGFPPPFPDGMNTAIFVANFGYFRASLLWFCGIALVLALFLHRSNFGNWIFATRLPAIWEFQSIPSRLCASCCARCWLAWLASFRHSASNHHFRRQARGLSFRQSPRLSLVVSPWRAAWAQSSALSSEPFSSA
jgi:ribose/xylose/arabinose/galactoside ABC-type transport system permease subunit